MTTGLGNTARVIALACIGGLGACGGKAIVVERDFPEPLIDALPLNVGIVYDEELQSFSFLDTTIDGATWSVDLGSSNVRLFDQIFTALFRQTTRLESVSSASGTAAPLDAIIAPVIEEYAFLAPSESGSNFWAVSIRYRMELYDARGQLLTDWPVVAYGKSRSKALQGGESLAEATTYALRDAAAALAVEIPEKPEVLAMLQPPPAPAASPGPAAGEDAVVDAVEDARTR